MGLVAILVAVVLVAAAIYAVWRARVPVPGERPTPSGAPKIAPVADGQPALPERSVEPPPVATGMKLASLGDLAGGLAHEINNPVAIMVEEAGWMADLLEEEEFAQCSNLPELRRAVAQIQTQGARVREITRNLLSFAHRTAVKMEKVDVNAVVREVARLSETRAREAGVAVRQDLASSLPVCRASISGLQQVVTNLVYNAVDATDSGGSVELSTRHEGDTVLVAVKDTGHGISKENLARIFDPFFTTKPVGKGTGLGLSICHGIVSNMNGTIAVESTPGQGTTFLVKLQTAEASSRPSAPMPVAEDPDATGERMDVTVLLVDDEVAFVDALRRRLERRGAITLSAHSGEEALATLEANRGVDVVLLDLRMPGMDGLTALGEIKRMRPLVEVMLLSGHATLEAAIEGMKLGAFDYAIKPCDMPRLLSRIVAAKRRKDSQEHKILEARIKDITMRRL